MSEVRIERYRVQSIVGPFLRMLAHFDALDGDEDLDEVQPRYELLYPEDSWTMPDFTEAFYRRLCNEMINGPAV